MMQNLDTIDSISKVPVSYQMIVNKLAEEVWTLLHENIKKGHLDSTITVSNDMCKTIEDNTPILISTINTILRQNYFDLRLTKLTPEFTMNNQEEAIAYTIINFVQIVDIPNFSTRLQTIEKQIEEMYFAPGMPGYIQAQTHFESTKE